MAREIKFRAWDKADRMMLYPGWNAERGERFITIGHMFQLGDSVDLMQYTGLTDKNGKPIYEGDVVYVKQNIYAQKHLTVEWGYDRWEFKEEFDNGDYYNGYAIHWEEVEVLGNIYENPDLLDKQT